MKIIALFLIKKYKKHISPIFEYMGINCKYYPTCSEYMRPSYNQIWFFSWVIFRNKKNNKMQSFLKRRI